MAMHQSFMHPTHTGTSQPKQCPRQGMLTGTHWPPPSVHGPHHVAEPACAVAQEGLHHGQRAPHALPEVLVRARVALPQLQA
jgi:hypothetical protein